MLGGSVSSVQEQQVDAQALQSGSICQGRLPAHVPGVQDGLHSTTQRTAPLGSQLCAASLMTSPICCIAYKAYGLALPDCAPSA